MKNELGITKGEWTINEKISRNEYGANEFTIDSKKCGVQSMISVYFGDPEQGDRKEAEANAKLIAEAGTVANETGKTPRQLSDDNKVLLEALKEMIRTVNPTDVTPNKVSMGVSLGEYYVGGCSFPSDKSIHMAINAIKQVTE